MINKIKKLALLISISFIFVSCSSKNTILDLNINQNTNTLPNTTSNIENEIDFLQNSKKLLQRKFELFEITNIKEKPNELFWAFNVYKYNPKKKYFGSNLKPLEESFFKSAKSQANMQAIGQISSPAITTANTSLRNFPTSSMMFLNPSKPGEGYPFDYLQISSIPIAQPLFVSHYSLDKAWAFVKDDTVWGWVKVNDIKLLSKDEAEKYKSQSFIAILEEEKPVYSLDDEFLFYSRVGTILAFDFEDKENFIGKIYTRSGIKNYKISKKYATHFPIKFNNENVKQIISGLLNQPYGWGGIDSMRDCSLFTRDFLAGFGIWLPRNSKAQSAHGTKISLKNLTKKEKIDIIKTKAIPYLSLLHLKGHIMLYIGVNENNDIMVLHDAWGIHTRGNGRAIIGGINITTLDVGKNRWDIPKENLLINKIDTLTILDKP